MSEEQLYCSFTESQAKQILQHQAFQLKQCEFVACRNRVCQRMFCSLECEELAWRNFHEYECPTLTQAPFRKLFEFCLKQGRSNPIVASRVLVMSLQKLECTAEEPPKTHLDKRVRWIAAQQSVLNFVNSPEESEGDAYIAHLLKSQFSRSPYAAFITVEWYRLFHGTMLRNASSARPLSPLHSALSDTSISPALQLQLLDILNLSVNAEEVLSSRELQNITLETTGLYVTLDSMNHSCEPNVMLVSAHDNHTLSAVAKRAIQKGEQLYISYIDECLPRQKRQNVLRRMYHFECECTLCKLQQC